MSQPAEQLLRPIERACADDSQRAACRADQQPHAEALYRHLPWVHRTGRPESGTWRQIFSDRRLLPSPASAHEQAAGRASSVYFFLGSCAFPKGNLVLLLWPVDPSVRARANFTPFDTGSLGRFVGLTQGHEVCAEFEPWQGTDDYRRCLMNLSGRTEELGIFAPTYIAAHFYQPLDYVRRPQRSAPDFPPYHGLSSYSGDRRVWTIEIQVEGDEGVALDDQVELLVRGKDRFDALPAAFKDRAIVVTEGEDEDEADDPLAVRFSEKICARFAGVVR